MGWLKKLFGREQEAEKGSVLVMGALSLVGVLGLSGLAVEASTGYAAKIRNQRVADMAALGAAVAYQAALQMSSAQQASTPPIDVAKQTACDIVNANGISTTCKASSAGTTVDVAQTTVGTQSALQVTVTTPVPVRLAAIVANGAPTYSVKNTSYASLTGNATTACIVALSNANNTNGVSATGGASVNANGCAINSNATIASDNSSAKITAKQVVGRSISDAAAAYNQNAITTSPAAGNIQARAGAASDTLMTGAALKTALCYVNKLTNYNDPDYNGGNKSCTDQTVPPTVYTSASTTDWSTNYNPKTASGFDSYKTADYQCVYNVPQGTYDIRNLSVGGGCTITFAAGSTLKFAQIDMNGTDMTIGNGQLIVTGTFNVNGNNTINIGNGLHSFGVLNIGGGKSLTLGSGSLNINSKLSLSGGSVFKANISAGDTVVIGATNGVSIDVGGGSKLCFTSDCLTATAAAGTFSTTGTVNNGGGGSTIVFPKAVTHVIGGDLSLAAAADFGPGLYVIKGNWTNGTGCGGCVMQGQNVTFALGGTFNFAGGTSFDLSATTTSTPTYGLTDMLILTKSSAGTSISAGSTGLAGGLIYAPNSAFTSSGGSAISSNGSQCMMLVVSTVAVSGSGTINTKNCASQASTATGTVALLQ